MESNEELKKIKKKYGEKFMHMCRELFPTLLEEEGLLLGVLENTFADNSKSLYDSIHDNDLEVDFRNYIYKKVNAEKEVVKKEEKRTPYELLDEAGYDLYECETEEDIRKFEPYYRQDELLCTFGGNRLDRCVVFFAVKKNVDEIRRENFTEPKREDEYGTSVMSIQFYKRGVCTVSIKNRYNHTVVNPDATYGNNLDKIIVGLSESFKNLLAKRGLNLVFDNIEGFKLPDYVVANDGKHYKYNIEMGGTYFCPGNIVIDEGQAVKIGEPEKVILAENYVIDLVNKSITQYIDGIFKDSFTDGLKDIEKIEVIKEKEAKNGERVVIITQKGSKFPIKIRLDRDNQIIGYENEKLLEIGHNFLPNNLMLRDLNLPNVIAVGDDFLEHNIGIKHLSLPNLVCTGDNFLKLCCNLSQVDLPKLRETGNRFLYFNIALTQLSLPALERVKNYFLSENNEALKQIECPQLREVGNGFLGDNKGLICVNFPNLQEAGHHFLYWNTDLEQLELPKLAIVGDGFLDMNEKLKQLSLPRLVEAGGYFLDNNEDLEQINLPRLKRAGNYFLGKNRRLKSLDLPSLEKMGMSCLSYNTVLSELRLPRVRYIGSEFLGENMGLTSLVLPELVEVENRFLWHNKALEKFEAPKLEKVGMCFLEENESLKEINIPKLKEAGKFLLSKMLFNPESLGHNALSRLDKASGLTSREVTQGKILIAKLNILLKKMFIR